MDQSLEALQVRLKHQFKDVSLLRRALTHPSYVFDHPEEKESNQRLEFLGDSVLQLCLARALFDKYPQEPEGQLSKRRSIFAKGEYLARLARELGVPACLRLGQSEENSKGREKASLLEDAFEAIVGAVYLDTDFYRAQAIVLALYGDFAVHLDVAEDVENPKGRLQELIQPRLGNNAIRYEVVAVLGGDHERQYEVAVFVADEKLGQGRGTSKKSAEATAARMALLHLEKNAQSA